MTMLLRKRCRAPGVRSPSRPLSLCANIGGAYLGFVLRRYIAVDGTSLTVCDVDRAGGWFTFMLIPYTQQHIIVPRKAVGDRWAGPGCVWVCMSGAGVVGRAREVLEQSWLCNPLISASGHAGGS
jgi:hypothetical protein